MISIRHKCTITHTHTKTVEFSKEIKKDEFSKQIEKIESNKKINKIEFDDEIKRIEIMGPCNSLDGDKILVKYLKSQL